MESENKASPKEKTKQITTVSSLNITSENFTPSSFNVAKDKRAIFIPNVPFLPNKEGILKYKIQIKKLPTIENTNQKIVPLINLPSLISLKNVSDGPKQTNAKIKNIKNGAIMEYTIVGESETNFREGKLAVGTPIAKALLGHSKGETVDVQVPSGLMQFEILDISI